MSRGGEGGPDRWTRRALSSPCSLSPGRGRPGAAPLCPVSPKAWVDAGAEGRHSPAELDNEMLAASTNTLLGTGSEASPRWEPRGQWADGSVDSLSCSEPDTKVLELLPSLPERSHMTLGAGILAFAISLYGQKNWAQAPGALCGHYRHHPLGSRKGGHLAPSRPPLLWHGGPACPEMPPCSLLTQGVCTPVAESGPRRPGGPPGSSAGCKIKYLPPSRARNARAGVAPTRLLWLPKPASSSCGSHEKQPDGHL